MKDFELKLFSASAGTGKTYTLAKELVKAVSVTDGESSAPVRSTGLLATTFTNKAAAELAERLRGELINEGRQEDTDLLAASYMGTVNAVCSRIVSDFAFELGISPRLRVLDENAAGIILSTILSDIATPEQQQQLQQLASRLSDESNPSSGDERFGWQKAVEKVMAAARNNNIASDDLGQSCEKSVSELLAPLPPTEAGATIEKALQVAIDSYLSGVNKLTKKDESLLTLRAKLDDSGMLPWSVWQSTVKGYTTKTDKFGDVPVAAARYVAHAQFQQDLRDQIQLVFEISACALKAYDDYKSERGLIDFIDQEVYCRRALELEDIRDSLSGTLDLISVDEFQDTSPLQLDLFLSLGTLAHRSIWVGDRKQSVYGFRDADPELMQAVEKRLRSGGAEVEQLRESYRTRDQLCAFTSDVFVPAFGRYGFTTDEVELSAAAPLKSEPPDMGPALEYWILDTGEGRSNAEKQASALAHAVGQLLADTSVRCWHWKQDGENSRPVNPGDVAILCRKNSQCARVATALRHAGIPVSLASPGLLATQEGRLLFAGLRAWADPRDDLAAAEVWRLTEEDPNAADWPVRLRDREAVRDSASVKALREIAENALHLSVPEVVMRVVEVLDLDEICLAWGDADQRQANVEAFLADAYNYEAQCESLVTMCTLAGFIWHLEQCADKNSDLGGKVPTDAVIVSTCHSAKGLEWPIVVLYDLEGSLKPRAFGVNVMSDGDLTLESPLSNRWVRYWPNPLSSRTKESVVFDALGAAMRDGEESARAEETRLQYVAMTRAMNRLVFAGKKGFMEKGILSELRDEDGNSVLHEPDGDALVVGGTVHTALLRTGVADALESQGEREPGRAVELPEGRAAHPPATVLPSALHVESTADANPLTLGSHLKVSGTEAQVLGNAAHAYLGSVDSRWQDEQKVAFADSILKRWNVNDAFGPDALVEAGNKFFEWCSDRWPDARALREWPITMRLEEGSILNGIIDLVLELPDGFVIIDHKTYAGKMKEAERQAKGYAGQLSAYADAYGAATGTACLGTYIHMPIMGVVWDVRV
jgi:ATP-dependent helicase/nuclease subunit A